MRRIRKSVEPATFTAWRNAIRPHGSIPPWDDFPDPPRAEARRILSDDQAKLCCYCCASIANESYHIEHFRPRAHFQTSTYSWKNLLASCEGWPQIELPTSIVATQRHCGAAKDNWFEDGVTVDPQASGVDSLFIYRLDGRIFARKTLHTLKKANVELTIKKLNLDAPSLRARRSAILTQAALDVGKMTKANWVRHYLHLRADGGLQEFAPALQYNFDKHWSEKMK